MGWLTYMHTQRSMGRRLTRSVRMTDIINALVRSRHSLYMFVSVNEPVL